MQEIEQFEEAPEEILDLGAKQIWAIGGGKGGVGKSFVTANLAIGLAQKGAQVIVVDADLGGANMHTCLGIPYPPHTLADFIDNKVATLEEILLPTAVPRLRLISGASDILALANPQYSQKQKIIRHLKKLKADYILLDLGAGTTYNVLDFFNLAHRKLIVVTPEPTSIQNGYGFLKSALYRYLSRLFHQNVIVSDLLKGGGSFGGQKPPETIKQIIELLSREIPEVGEQFREAVKGYQCKLILNMASPPHDQKVYSVVRSVSMGFLSLELELLGAIGRDDKVMKSVDQMSPLLLSYPESEAARKLRQILEKI
jgi:flagellar biosynthesis protein FlhG